MPRYEGEAANLIVIETDTFPSGWYRTKYNNKKGHLSKVGLWYMAQYASARDGLRPLLDLCVQLNGRPKQSNWREVFHVERLSCRRGLLGRKRTKIIETRLRKIRIFRVCISTL